MSAVGELSLMFRRDGDQVVVSLGGEFDAASAEECEDRLSDLIDGQGNLSLRFDLRDLEFIDSSGLHVLAGALGRLRERGGDLVLYNPQPSVRRVLDICGLTQAVSVRTSGDN